MHSLNAQFNNRSICSFLLPHRGATLLLAAAAAISAPVPQVSAQQTNPYSITQPIDLTWVGTQVPELKFDYYVYAFAVTASCTSTVNPVPGPPPGNLQLTSRVPIVQGQPIVKQIHAVTTSSEATATSSVDVGTIAAGSVQGSYTTSGEVHPRADGCGNPRAGRATAEAKAEVLIKNGPEMRKGRVGVNAGWQSLGKLGGVDVNGRGKNRITAKDPIIARLYDLTTGITTSYVLATVLVSVDEGFVNWQGGIFSSTAQYLSYDLKIQSPVTLQQGRLRLIVENGIVTERIATGMFTGGMGFPGVGQSGNFSTFMPAISLDYDLGGDLSHILETEVEFSCGVAKDDVDAGLDTGGSLLNEIGVGANGSNVSVLPTGDSNLGFALNTATRHLADRFFVAPGTQKHLTALRWPVYEIDNAALNLAGAYVRLWKGNPMNGGVLMAGDMSTNRLLAVNPTNIYRVGAATLTSNLRKVKDAVIDMTWAPILAPGEYWIEVAVDGINSPAVFSPTGVWKSPTDNALTYDPTANQWSIVKDTLSQRQVSFPYDLFGEILPGPICPADINHDGFINVGDLLAVINNWGQPGGPADVNHDFIVNVNDMLLVINTWGPCGPPLR